MLAGDSDIFARYPVRDFDETFAAPAELRPHYETVIDGFRAYGNAEFKRRRGLIELILRNQGITFTVYGDAQGTERAFLFNPFLRVIPASEWERLERGLLQCVGALNAFLHDIYHAQEIVKGGLIPEARVTAYANFRPQMQGVTLPFGPTPTCWAATSSATPRGSTACLRTTSEAPKASPTCSPTAPGRA